MIKIGNFFFRYRNGLFPGLYALLFVGSASVFSDFRLAALLGLGFAIAGQALRAITIGLEYIVRGGRNRQVYAENLVTGGVFAHCRNPLYVGNFLIIVGLAVASNSVFSMGVLIPLFAVIYRTIVAAEENYLLGKFGSAFTEYCGRVNRWIPNLKGFRQTLSGMTYNWRRLITAEYGSTYIWVAGVIALTIRSATRNSTISWSSPLVVSLGVLFFIATLGYGAARILKKTGALVVPTRRVGSDSNPQNPVPLSPS